MSPIIMCPSKIIQEYILNIWSAPIGNDSAWLLFSKLIYVPVTVYLIIIYLYSFKTCWLFCTPIWVSGVRLDDEMLRINKSTHPPPPWVPGKLARLGFPRYDGRPEILWKNSIILLSKLHLFEVESSHWHIILIS